MAHFTQPGHWLILQEETQGDNTYVRLPGSGTPEWGVHVLAQHCGHLRVRTPRGQASRLLAHANSSEMMSPCDSQLSAPIQSLSLFGPKSTSTLSFYHPVYMCTLLGNQYPLSQTHQLSVDVVRSLCQPQSALNQTEFLVP